VDKLLRLSGIGKQPWKFWRGKCLSFALQNLNANAKKFMKLTHFMISIFYLNRFERVFVILLITKTFLK
jgi:hypothetical protein